MQDEPWQTQTPEQRHYQESSTENLYREEESFEEPVQEQNRYVTEQELRDQIRNAEDFPEP